MPNCQLSIAIIKPRRVVFKHCAEENREGPWKRQMWYRTDQTMLEFDRSEKRPIFQTAIELPLKMDQKKSKLVMRLCEMMHEKTVIIPVHSLVTSSFLL